MRKDRLYDIALNCAQSVRVHSLRQSTKYCHGTFNANSRQGRRPEAPPGLIYPKVRAFYPMADNRGVPRRRAGHYLPRPPSTTHHSVTPPWPVTNTTCWLRSCANVAKRSINYSIVLRRLCDLPSRSRSTSTKSTGNGVNRAVPRRGEPINLALSRNLVGETVATALSAGVSRRDRAATDVPHGRASISIRCRRQSRTPCRERILFGDELPYIFAIFLRLRCPNDLHEDLGMRARRTAKAASTSSFVAPFPARMEARPASTFWRRKLS